MKQLVLVTALFFALHAEAKTPLVFDPEGDPVSLAATFLKADKLNVLSKVQRVAVVCYRVEFGIENSGKASSSGSGGFSSSRSDIKLMGVTDETRQALTDSLYDHFVAGLAAAGYEVVPYATLREEKNYKAMEARFRKTYEPVGTQLGKSVFLGPYDMPVYTTNDDKHLGLGIAFSGGFTVQPQNYEPQIAKSLNAAVIRATLDVQFADMEKSGGLFRSDSSVKTTSQLALVPAMSQYLIVSPAGRAKIALKQTIAIGGDALTLRDVTTGGEKTAEAVGNVVTGLLTGGVRSTRHYEADTTPEAYSNAIGRYAKSYQSAVLTLFTAKAG